MFLKDLTPDCQSSFLALAKLLAAADGILAPEELAMLDDVASEMGISSDSVSPTEAELEVLCAAVHSPEVRAYMLMELASLAHIDDDFASEERQLLRAISDLWNIDTITLIRIEAWAETRVEMSREAAEIVQEIKTWQP